MLYDKYVNLTKFNLVLLVIIETKKQTQNKTKTFFEIWMFSTSFKEDMYLGVSSYNDSASILI